MNERSGPFRLKVFGANACFTRPEMKVERVSYEVITPSAARGILEAILWKPAIRWVVDQIDVLRPITWESVRRNEVGAVVPVGSVKTAMKRRTGNLALFIEDNRQQRAGLFLRDVAYVIHAHFEMTDRAGDADSVTKFEQMFIRRASNGQCFHRPYFGCREFPVDFEFIPRGEQSPTPLDLTKDLGWMLYDLDFESESPVPHFFNARIEDGVLNLRGLELRS